MKEGKEISRTLWHPTTVCPAKMYQPTYTHFQLYPLPSKRAQALNTTSVLHQTAAIT
ncbi:hypothetical protein CHS0354_008236, partial [Potamilus streckersoni]